MTYGNEIMYTVQFKMYSVHEPKVHLHSLSMCLGEDGYRTRWTFSVCEGSRRRGVTKRSRQKDKKMIFKAALKSADPHAHVHTYGWVTDDNGHTAAIYHQLL